MHDRMEHLIEKQISHGNFSTQTWAKTENPGRSVSMHGVGLREEEKETAMEKNLLLREGQSSFKSNFILSVSNLAQSPPA